MLFQQTPSINTIDKSNIRSLKLKFNIFFKNIKRKQNCQCFCKKISLGTNTPSRTTVCTYICVMFRVIVWRSSHCGIMFYENVLHLWWKFHANSNFVWFSSNQLGHGTAQFARMAKPSMDFNFCSWYEYSTSCNG